MALVEQVIQVYMKPSKMLSLDPNELLRAFSLAIGAEAGLIWFVEGQKPAMHLRYIHVKPMSSNKDSHSAPQLQTSPPEDDDETVPEMVIED